MADKYIIHGATYYGDGTSSAEATADGGVGAWNNINIVDGTAPSYGSLAAGDTVYIRSKTSAGADITVTLGANITLGSASATTGSRITWVLDNGAVWSGIDGLLTYTCPSTFTVNTRQFNKYVAKTMHALRIVEENTTASLKVTFTQTGGITNGFYVDLSAGAGQYGAVLGHVGNTQQYNIGVKAFKRGSGGVFPFVGNATAHIYNPQIELTDAAQTNPVFACSLNNGQAFVHGGRVFGAGASSGVHLAIMNIGDLHLDGLDFPAEMLLNVVDTAFVASHNAGGTGSVLRRLWGTVDSRNDGNYPTLTASLPDSAATGWSWKFYPSGATPDVVGALHLNKFYAAAAATKTITVNLLQGTAFTTLNKSNCWLEVVYTDDTTGLTKFITSESTSTAALDGNTAPWSADFYGALTFDKKQLTITTPTSIKQDSLVMLSVRCNTPALSTTNLLFICPDVQMT